MVIIGLKKRRGRLLQLELDDGRFEAVDIRTFEESPYKAGSSLSDSQLHALLEQSGQRRAKEKALYLLSMRDHSRVELEKKLLRESDCETAASTAARMEELGLVDDCAFAKRRALDMLTRKFYPGRRIIQELCALGVSRELAQGTVAELDFDDVQQALALLRKKYYNRKDGEDRLRKTAGALARYGFDGDSIRRAMKEWQSEEQDFDIDDL